MRFTIAAAGLVAVANATQWNYGAYAAPSNVTTTAAPVYTTEVVTEYTTYCPGPTAIEHGGVTYTVTEATTLTITNCPCTVTKPVYSSVVTECSTCAPPAAPTYPASVPAPPYPSANSTIPAAPIYPPATGTGAYAPPASTSPPPAGYTGAANKASFGVAGLLAAAGLVAAL